MGEVGRYASCPNCGDPAPREFCAACGQRNLDLHVSFRKLAGELVGELASLDSRLLRTLRPFLFQPGALTRAYVAGRRRSFSSPIRLFLVASFVLFVIAPLRQGGRGDAKAGMNPQSRAELAHQADELRRGGFFQRRVGAQLARMATEDPQAMNQRLVRGFFEAMPKVAFVLLPAFALLLKLLYVRSGRFYAEHLVFSLHLHAFGFLVLGAAMLAHVGVVGLLSVGVIVVYGVVALRRVYGQSWPMTLLKATALGLTYLLVIAGGVTIAAFVAFLTT